MKRKLLAILLSCSLLISVLPAAALAGDAEDGSTAASEPEAAVMEEAAQIAAAEAPEAPEVPEKTETAAEPEEAAPAAGEEEAARTADEAEAAEAAQTEAEPEAEETASMLSESPFTDVQNTGAYYYEPVLWAVNHKITSGITAETFAPNRSCTRAEVVTFLYRVAGEPAIADDTKNPFTDVKETDYFYKAVLWAVKQGITAGKTATTFAPGKPCTRAEVVTFLYRASDTPAVGKTNAFVDVQETDYYYNAVLWAAREEITAGLDTTHFGPKAECTRGQIVTFLWRYDGNTPADRQYDSGTTQNSEDQKAGETAKTDDTKTDTTKTDTTKTDTTKTDTTQTDDQKKTDSKISKLQAAAYFDQSVAGTYTVDASRLNMRYGADVNQYDVVTQLNNGTKVVCYGYYNVDSNGTKWLVVVSGSSTGYCSSEFLVSEKK